MPFDRGVLPFLAAVLLAVWACSGDPKPVELDLMIGAADLQALCGPGVGPPEIEVERFPLKMRKVSTSYEDTGCGISLHYRLYTYSSAGGARDKFQAYQATYDSFPGGFGKRVSGDGQRLEYLRRDGTALAFLSRAGSSLISGSIRGSEERVERMRGIVQANSQRLGSSTWD